jgi:hypothetical protein
MIFRVPDGITVETQKNLSGEYSSLCKSTSSFSNPNAKECYWYGAVRPDNGWNIISRESDPQKTAEK